MISYMYITGQGLVTPGGRVLMSNKTFCHYSQLLHVSPIHFFFMISYIYKAQEQGQISPRG